MWKLTALNEKCYLIKNEIKFHISLYQNYLENSHTRSEHFMKFIERNFFYFNTVILRSIKKK